ncbi:MAG: hypothetical protein ACYSTN_09985, partial [Planctomycetota bacterium]
MCLWAKGLPQVGPEVRRQADYEPCWMQVFLGVTYCFWVMVEKRFRQSYAILVPPQLGKLQLIVRQRIMNPLD